MILTDEDRWKLLESDDFVGLSTGKTGSKLVVVRRGLNSIVYSADNFRSAVDLAIAAKQREYLLSLHLSENGGKPADASSSQNSSSVAGVTGTDKEWEEAVEELASYASHFDRCGVDYRGTCDCGLDDALASLRSSLASAEVAVMRKALIARGYHSPGECPTKYERKPGTQCSACVVALAPDSGAALLARLQQLEKDKERLDFLDECNRRLNAGYGTYYGWELVLSPNVTRLMFRSPWHGEAFGADLNDANCNGKKTVREAIDAALSGNKEEPR